MDQRFTVILVTVVGITLTCGGIACIIAMLSPDPARPMTAELFKTCTTLFHTGVGAIIGLLGGHAM
jgi:uncharacterized membrane protein HdeD (DUF308 family)